jgi:hypothetical protein
MTLPPDKHPAPQPAQPSVTATGSAAFPPPPSKEIGGRDGPEPTRFGDWEKAGRCIDF